MGINNINLIVLKNALHFQDSRKLADTVHSYFGHRDIQLPQFLCQNTAGLANGNWFETFSVQRADYE
jgi:hypothetical protein